VITFIALRFRKTDPYVLMGWGWYVLMLVPVIGLVQISYYAHADRYTYLPQIGLLIAITWLVAERSKTWVFRNEILGATSIVILAGLMVLARGQVGHWADSETLWRHALSVTDRNVTAHLALGSLLAERGERTEAIKELQAAVSLKPSHLLARVRLGNAFRADSRFEDAFKEYGAALRIDSSFAPAIRALAETHHQYGDTLLRSGKVAVAIDEYKKALSVEPRMAKTHANLGIALADQGKLDEAIAHYRSSIALRPDPETLNNLGAALAQSGRWQEAIQRYREAIQLDPNYIEARVNLGSALALRGSNEEAVAQLEEAVGRTNGSDATILIRLATTYAMLRRFEDAERTALLASTVGRARGDTQLEAAARNDAAEYRKRYR
jgi:tetratricopeptide (TPR) repeat protein